MAYGAFCGAKQSQLFFIPGKANFNSALYTTFILEPLLIPFWHERYEEYGWVKVVEDGASGHCRVANAYWTLNEVDVLL